jgi:hypothetical protein
MGTRYWKTTAHSLIIELQIPQVIDPITAPTMRASTRYLFAHPAPALECDFTD